MNEETLNRVKRNKLAAPNCHRHIIVLSQFTWTVREYVVPWQQYTWQ